MNEEGFGFPAIGFTGGMPLFNDEQKLEVAIPPAGTLPASPIGNIGVGHKTNSPVILTDTPQALERDDAVGAVTEQDNRCPECRKKLGKRFLGSAP